MKSRIHHLIGHPREYHKTSQQQKRLMIMVAMFVKTLFQKSLCDVYIDITDFGLFSSVFSAYADVCVRHCLCSFIVYS